MPLTCWVLVVLQEGVVVRVTHICLLQEQYGTHSEREPCRETLPLPGRRRMADRQKGQKHSCTIR